MSGLVCPSTEQQYNRLLVVTARRRATYDMFGEEGLKGGIPVGVDESGTWTSGYTFHGDADRVFRDFFGGDNPFQGLLMVTCYCIQLKLCITKIDLVNCEPKLRDN